MALVVVYDEGASPQSVLEVLPSVHTPDYEGRTDVLINPDLSPVAGVPERYWKVVGSAVAEYSQAEKDAQDAADAAALDAAIRASGKQHFDGQIPVGLAMRAFAKIVMDEINILRAQHSLPDRTLEQLKSAIQTAIDNGDVDE
jgi:hypothetical protein